MPDIKRVICGTLPKTMPNGKKVTADYYEFIVNGETAELIRYEGDEKVCYDIDDDIVVEVALQEIERLLDENPDEQPFNEMLPLAKNVIFADGTVKYVPKDELLQLLSNIIPMKAANYVMPQGLVAAPSPAGNVLNNFNNIGLGMGIQNGMNNMPMLQGIVRAFPPSEVPEKTDVSEKWKCENCGAVSGGRFCSECGSPKPNED